VRTRWPATPATRSRKKKAGANAGLFSWFDVGLRVKRGGVSCHPAHLEVSRTSDSSRWCGIKNGLTAVLEGLRHPAGLVRMRPPVVRRVAARACGRRRALQCVVELASPDRFVVPQFDSHAPASIVVATATELSGSCRSPRRGTPSTAAHSADRSGGTGCAAAWPAARRGRLRRPTTD